MALKNLLGQFTAERASLDAEIADCQLYLVCSFAAWFL
jgi:hypothetical protein